MLGYGPLCFNLGHYASIWAILLRFGPYFLDLGYLAEFGSENRVFRLDLGHFARLWAIMLGFGPFCLDLGILLRFGSYCLDLGYLAEFGSEMMDLRPELVFWAAAPKGTKSCRSQGDFCSSVHSFVCLFVHSSSPDLASQTSNPASQVSNQVFLAPNPASQASNQPLKPQISPLRL